jgi:Ca2+-binding EF-hand superfamily protein
VLGALDSDHDGIISESEIVDAPAALRRLDANHDGRLTAEECGFPQADPKLAPRARMAFLTVHPVLAALDADHDGEISAREITYAAAALRTLDRNGDGRLTENEILPNPVLADVAEIMLVLDTNADGRLSPQERSTATNYRLRALLDRADVNRDGFVTEEELTAAVLADALATRLWRPQPPQ